MVRGLNRINEMLMSLFKTNVYAYACNVRYHWIRYLLAMNAEYYAYSSSILSILLSKSFSNLNFASKSLRSFFLNKKWHVFIRRGQKWWGICRPASKFVVNKMTIIKPERTRFEAFTLPLYCHFPNMFILGPLWAFVRRCWCCVVGPHI